MNDTDSQQRILVGRARLESPEAVEDDIMWLIEELDRTFKTVAAAARRLAKNGHKEEAAWLHDTLEKLALAHQGAHETLGR